MKRGKKAICAMLLLLLLPGCAILRVLTELPEGEIVEYVRLRDGYLRFVNGNYNYLGFSNYSLAARVIELPYEDIVTDLGFDPVEMTQMLPEKFHMTEECLEEVHEGTNPPYQMPLGGYGFCLKGEPWEFGKFGKICLYPQFPHDFQAAHGGGKERHGYIFSVGYNIFRENAALGGDVFGRPRKTSLMALRDWGA